MKAQAFVPGHISCIFRPFRHPDVERTGSLGVGLRLDKGCTAAVSGRDDGKLLFTVNGVPAEPDITAAAVRELCPGAGFDIDIIHDLPLGQGFGTSASGTYAVLLSVCELLGIPKERALEVTHKMECTMGGGLGDLIAIASGYEVPVRTVPGSPVSIGHTEDPGISVKRIALVVFSEPLPTKSVIKDEDSVRKVASAGDEAMGMFRSDMTADGLFRVSNIFSERIGLESDEVREGMRMIRNEGYHAGMCMLGNSIYSDAPEKVVRRLFPDETVIMCSTSSDPVSVIRTE